MILRRPALSLVARAIAVPFGWPPTWSMAPLPHHGQHWPPGNADRPNPSLPMEGRARKAGRLANLDRYEHCAARPRRVSALAERRNAARRQAIARKKLECAGHTMHVARTADADFIGSHLAPRLKAEGHVARVMDNLSTRSEGNLRHSATRSSSGGTISPIRSSASGWSHASTSSLHVAALPTVPRSLLDAWPLHDATVNATLRVLEACRHARVRLVVHSSLSSVYGDTLHEDHTHRACRQWVDFCGTPKPGPGAVARGPPCPGP